MKCPKCGKDNNDSAKFCNTCGEPLTGKDENKTDKNIKVIIALGIIAVVLVGAIMLSATGIIRGDVPLEHHDFERFEIDIPKGSDFVVGDSMTTKSSFGMMTYKNNGKYSNEVYGITILTSINSTSEKMITHDMKQIKNNNSTRVYEGYGNASGMYQVIKDFDKGTIVLLGYDLKTMERMIETANVKNTNGLTNSGATLGGATTTQATSTAPAPAQTSSPMKIQSGSFSTGSAEEDKTYASIYVGKEHAGESVTVQIFYSRDGNSLNNGNMVPVTVHSDGYVEVSSADAYHYYPDYAKINLYSPSGSLLDSRSVSLSPTSGTQTF